MKNLKKVIKEENSFAKFFDQPLIDENNITDEVAQKLFARLDSNLSPECLYQDGERSPAAAKKYEIMYVGAIKELQAMGFKYNQEFYSYYG